MPTDHVTLLSPAKVNLFLEIGGRREDGYHDLVTVFQALDERASDLVEIAVADTLSVICLPDIGVSMNDNIVTRALVRLGDVVGRKPEFAVTIRKHLPAAAGLGGASSNAAAALVGACILWGIEPASTDVLGVARELGADVPFFIEGGTALYGGRGDVLTKRLPTPALALVLVNPGEPVSTAIAYATFDRRLRSAPANPSALLHELAEGDVGGIARSLGNNLGEVAVEIAPSVGAALAFVQSAPGVLRAIVAGSGSTVFGICESEAAAGRVASEAARREGWWAVAAGTSPFGVRRIGTDGGS